MPFVVPGSTATKARARTAAVLEEAAWFPHDIDVAAGEATFVHVDRVRLAAEVFLDRWDRSGLRQCTLPLPALKEAPLPDRPAAVIWHTSFCCSTLLADCLDAPGFCLPLKEPWALPRLAEARRQGSPAASRDLVEASFCLLGRAFTPCERVVIKPTNGANLLLPLSAAATGPALLMYSSCRDYLAAVASGGPVIGGGEMRKGIARGLLAQRIMADKPTLKWSAGELFALTDFQAAALLWHVQVAEFRDFARAVGPGRGRSLDCERFLADPHGVLGAVDRFFDLGLGAARIGGVVEGHKLKRYAKKLDQPFDAEHRRMVFGQVERAFGRTIDAAVEWSYAMCPETPRGDPVGQSLMGLAH